MVRLYTPNKVCCCEWCDYWFEKSDDSTKNFVFKNKLSLSEKFFCSKKCFDAWKKVKRK